MPKGKVKWFNSKKGYGFITEDKTDKDIFLHVSELESSKLRVLKENQNIKFEIRLNFFAMKMELTCVSNFSNPHTDVLSRFIFLHEITKKHRSDSLMKIDKSFH